MTSTLRAPEISRTETEQLLTPRLKPSKSGLLTRAKKSGKKNRGGDGPAGPDLDDPAVSPDAKPTRLNYRPDIDGIRGAAAIMVMGYHAKVPGFEGAYIGLDLFFVVSGFVILNLLITEHERTGGIKWAAFYARRARRLIPAKATMLLTVIVVSTFLLDPLGAQQETAESAGAAAGFMSNFYFWKISDVSYFAHEPGTGVLLHTWSLSVEEQFYLALPFLIIAAAIISKLFKGSIHMIGLWVALGLAAGSLVLAIAWAQPYTEAAYYMPVTRAYEFLLGVALALVVRRIKAGYLIRLVLGFVGAGLIAYVLWQPMPTEGYPTYWALIPCMGAFFMVWAGTDGSTPVTKFLSNPLFVSLGLVSYGWYLWHWPFLVIGESINVAPPPLWGRIVLIFAALGVAVASYKYIEGRFYNRSGARPMGATWAPQRIVVAGVSSMALVATAAGASYVVADERLATPEWQAVGAQVNDFPEMPLECATPEEQIPQKPGPCYLNDFEEARGSVVMWGDSHSWMYIPAVRKAAQNMDVNLVSFNFGTCPPFDARGMELEGKFCQQNNVNALDFVEDLAGGDRPLQVILGGSWASYFGADPLNLLDVRGGDSTHNQNVNAAGRFLRRNGPSLFKELADLDVAVDVTMPIPEVPRSAPQCLARALPLQCNTATPNYLESEKKARRWLKKRLQVLPTKSRFIEVTQEFCDDQWCRAKVDGTVVYFDDNHLSASFARSLSQYFEPSVRSAAGLAGPG